jgi:hypothetical protein
MLDCRPRARVALLGRLVAIGSPLRISLPYTLLALEVGLVSENFYSHKLSVQEGAGVVSPRPSLARLSLEEWPF